MNVAEQKSAFIEAMEGIRHDREAELGKPTWKENAEAHGPRILYAELAGIIGRLKALIWDKPENEEYNFTKIKDLLLDLGNYDGFLYEFICELEANRLPSALGVDSDGWFVGDDGKKIFRHGSTELKGASGG